MADRSPVLDQPVFRLGVIAVPIIVAVMFVAFLVGVPLVIPVLGVVIVGWVCGVGVLLVRDARRRS
jgi:hypothetical protein